MHLKMLSANCRLFCPFIPESQTYTGSFPLPESHAPITSLLLLLLFLTILFLFLPSASVCPTSCFTSSVPFVVCFACRVVCFLSLCVPRVLRERVLTATQSLSGGSRTVRSVRDTVCNWLAPTFCDLLV